MKRKVISVVLAAAMAVGMLAGCGNSAASTATSTAASKAASTATSKAASTATSKAASTATSKAASTATSKAASTAASSASGASDTAAALSVKADKSYNIEVILKTLASEYWGYVNAGCAQAGKDLNVNVEVVGAASETAYDEQMNMITTALGSNSYDALVIAPLQADMVATQIASTSLPIIAVDTKITSDKVLTFVGTGNEAAGKQDRKSVV